MALPALIDDYLFIGACIVERLKDQLPAQGVPIAPQDVLPIEDLAQAEQARGTGGALLFVLWDGEQFNQADTGRANTSSTQQVQQIWTVVLNVRNASQVQGDAHNGSAGALLSAVHRALAGWTPPGALKPLLRAPGRRPDYQANSALYPLSFSVSMFL